MAAISTYLANKVIDHLLRNQAFTPPTTIYLALFTAATGLATNAPTAEVPTAGGTLYARQTCALDAASGGISANTSDITFPTAGASWGTVTHWALVDHATNVTWGTNVNVLKYGAVTVSKAVGIGDTARTDAGELDVTIV